MTYKLRGVRVEEYAYYVNFAKTLVWKHEYYVILWRHQQRTPNTNDHHMPLKETPPWKFSAYATGIILLCACVHAVKSEISLNSFSGQFFHKFLTPAPGLKEKHIISPESTLALRKKKKNAGSGSVPEPTLALRIRGHLCSSSGVMI